MAKTALVLLALGLAACVAEPEENACGAAGMQDLVGRDDAVLAAMTFPQGTRLIYPGTPVTEDYRPDRLNIDIDPSGTITGVWCG
ncbi:MAG: I78 family peptidase inhibitor [Pseudomonadota bacterium]